MSDDFIGNRIKNPCYSGVWICLLLSLAVSFSGSVSGQTIHSFYNGEVKLYYELIGEGPALYILSGGPGEAPEHPYRQIADSLKNFYTCVIMHQRGSGMSGDIPINENTINIRNYTLDIEVLRSLRGDSSISLLGVSWGGLLAMNYAAEYPRRVNCLFLICSAPPSYKLWHVLYANQYARRSLAELDSMAMLQARFSTKTEYELDSLKRADPYCSEVLAYKEYIAIHIRAMYYDKRNISLKHFENVFYSFNFQPIPIIDKEVVETRYDITRKLKELDIPALIVYGRQDDQGESTFFMQKECLVNSEIYVIEECGHEILDEQPGEFFRILISYVKRRQLVGDGP